ncbi:MAG: thioredoxin family protein [Thermoanaerobaculales bacterium]|jgi:peroxiredoxin|nr:thioredoxin family protein [Thermoanaerobaculales bacterium]
MHRLKIASVLLSIILGLAPAATAVAGVAVGDRAPGFSLTDAKGGTVSLADYEGKVVVLEWTNPDCPFVKRHNQEGSMKNLTSAYSDAGVVFLTVNSTNYMDRAANADFAAAQSIGWPLLVDQDGTVGHAYGAATTPHMFVIDRTGKIVYAGAIDDDPRGSKPAAERTNYVAKALDEVLAGKPVSTPETTPYGCSVKYK